MTDILSSCSSQGSLARGFSAQKHRFFLPRSLNFSEAYFLDHNNSNADVLVVDDERVVGSPKTLILAAGNDPLRDDGLIYAEKLKRNGHELAIRKSLRTHLTFIFTGCR